MNFLTRLFFVAVDAGETTGDKGTSAGEFLQKIFDEYIYGTTTKLILGLALALLLVVKGVMTGMQIVNAADDSGKRKEAINSLKYMIIGIAVVAVLYYGSSAIVSIFF